MKTLSNLAICLLPVATALAEPAYEPLSVNHVVSGPVWNTFALAPTGPESAGLIYYQRDTSALLASRLSFAKLKADAFSPVSQSSSLCTGAPIPAYFRASASLFTLVAPHPYPLWGTWAQSFTGNLANPTSVSTTAYDPNYASTYLPAGVMKGKALVSVLGALCHKPGHVWLAVNSCDISGLYYTGYIQLLLVDALNKKAVSNELLALRQEYLRLPFRGLNLASTTVGTPFVAFVWDGSVQDRLTFASKALPTSISTSVAEPAVHEAIGDVRLKIQPESERPWLVYESNTNAGGAENAVRFAIRKPAGWTGGAVSGTSLGGLDFCFDDWAHPHIVFASGADRHLEHAFSPLQADLNGNGIPEVQEWSYLGGTMPQMGTTVVNGKTYPTITMRVGGGSANASTATWVYNGITYTPSLTKNGMNWINGASEFSAPESFLIVNRGTWVTWRSKTDLATSSSQKLAVRTYLPTTP